MKKEIRKKLKEAKEAKLNAIDFINVYKSGFKDGYEAADGPVGWNKIQKLCLKSWDKRYSKLKSESGSKKYGKTN